MRVHTAKSNTVHGKRLVKARVNTSRLKVARAIYDVIPSINSVINKKTAPKDFLDKFLPRELEIIRSVSRLCLFISNYDVIQIYHPNIVQTHEIITINQKVFIALEWAGRGDLLGYVRLKGAIKEPEVRVSKTP